MSIKYDHGDEQIFLSFIVPVYNAVDFLRDCLDSLLAQNIEKEQYEIICIDDGSTDGSSLILEEYQKFHNNLRVFKQENRGVSSARNCGIQSARGLYIWFVDSDDCIKSNCLKQIWELLRNNTTQVLKFGHKKVIEGYSFVEELAMDFTRLETKEIMVGPCVWHTIFQKEFLTKNKILFNENMSYCEDALFQYYVWLNLEQEKGIEISDGLYYYRQRASSLSRIIDKKKITRQVLSFVEIARIYQRTEEDFKNDKRKLVATKQRKYLAVMNALTFLPETDLDSKEFLKQLKTKKLYPFPFLWNHIMEAKGKRKTEFIRSLFKCKWIYLIYYKIARKKGLIRKHKNSL